MRVLRFLLMTWCLGWIVTDAYAKVRIAKIFSSNMVLQQGQPNAVWGWADPGETLKITMNRSALSTIVASNGEWTASLPAEDYGGPYTLTIEGTSDKLTLENILIGEVWLCSGQSNMRAFLSDALLGDAEIEKAHISTIRLFTVPPAVNASPQSDLKGGKWVACSPQSIRTFSAVAYFFAKEIQNKLNVPVGLILSAQGATMAESWTSSSMMLKDPDFQSASVKLQSYSPETFKSEKTDSIIKLLGGRFPLKDSGMQQGNALYAQPTWDDNNWMNIEVPGFWENKGYPGIDGVAWYRRTVKLSSVKREAVTLHLGRVSNKEQVWINGVALKGEGSQVSRVYHIPVNVLKNGENQITVRIVNNQGGGGFGASYDSMYIKTSSRQEYIGGIWKFNVSEIFESCLRFESLGPNDFPSLLYNAMINPIIRYGIKGVIWYQGEHNTDRAKQYKRLFPNLILDWRLKWQLADLPFLFVSLPNYRKECQRPCESKWAELREAQTAALKLPNTGMAVAIDLGEADNLHPPNKQPIGYRLALNALRLAYQKDIVHVSPMFKSMQILENKIVLNFDHIGSGLVANDGSEMLKRFSIAGADRRFFWAKARIIGSNQVEVFASEVRKPVAVRYGWADNPGAVNFYNHEQLPVNSFRTDTWYRN